MATVSEAIGLALPYSAGAPAPYEIRDRFCTAAGEKIMELIARNIRPRDIVTRKALENAATVVAASGGSTNAGLHLPAIAHECGIKFDLFDVAEIFKRTPYIADLKPGGRYVAKDMFEAGGIPLLMKTLLDHGYLHGDCLTVTGRTIAENLAQVAWNPDQDVVRPADRPITPTGGVVGLKGNLAPEGAIVKVAGMKNAPLFRAGALLRQRGGVFRGGRRERNYNEGEVLVIRYEGPRGGPGMREMLSTTAALYGQGMGDKVALITDGRFSGRDARLLHRPCGAGGGRRRPDRPLARRRHDRDRRRGRTASKRGFRTTEWEARRQANGGRARRSIGPARSGSMPRSSDRRETVRSPIRVRPPRR